MKKTFLMMALSAGLVGFSACSGSENQSEDQTEQREDDEEGSAGMGEDAEEREGGATAGGDD